MREKLNLIGLIGILVVLSMAVLVTAVPLQITIITPEDGSIVTEEMLSDITVSETEYWLVKNG